jgi:hypothetical protein
LEETEGGSGCKEGLGEITGGQGSGSTSVIQICIKFVSRFDSTGKLLGSRSIDGSLTLRPFTVLRNPTELIFLLLELVEGQTHFSDKKATQWCCISGMSAVMFSAGLYSCGGLMQIAKVYWSPRAIAEML